MGMTIERIIEIFNDYDRINGIILRGNSEEETKYNCETIEALQSINVILHKYQKIKQIYQNWNEVYHNLIKVSDLPYNQPMIQIGEVLEDGNDD